MAKRNAIYPKEYVKSDGRKLIGGGPRDLQRKLQQTNVVTDTSYVEELKNQIESLRTELRKRQDTKSSEFYSPEEVDEEIRKAVAQAVAEAALEFKKNNSAANKATEPLVKTYKEQIVKLQKDNDDLKIMHSTMASRNADLEKRISKLKDELKSVEDLKKDIAILEQKITGKDELILALKSRPGIVGDEVVDPNRPKMEQVFIDPLEEDAGDGLESHIDIKETESDEVDGKVDKLRDLIGNKLPGGLK